MSKCLIFLCCIIFTSLPLYAKEIDFRQVVFGNAYENIIEVDTEQFFEKFPETQNIEDYGQGQLISDIKYKEKYSSSTLSYKVKWYEDSKEQTFEYTDKKDFHFRIFKEQYGNDVFYRMLVSLYELTDEILLDWTHNYYEQELFYQIPGGELIHVGSYTYRYAIPLQGGTVPVFNNVEIIQRNNKVNGILIYCFYNTEVTMMDWSHAVQGHEGVYFQLNEVLSNIKTSLDSINSAHLTANDNYFESQFPKKSKFIELGMPLIDSKRPFMYTLQNAFDGKPETSYVEDTEDDLFKVIIGVNNGKDVGKISIINGYASDIDTYKKNNQIKTIAHDINEVQERDKKFWIVKVGETNASLDINSLSYQIFDWIGYTSFYVKSINKGLRYNDTCLAEVNFYIEGTGWLFGNIE